MESLRKSHGLRFNPEENTTDSSHRTVKKSFEPGVRDQDGKFVFVKNPSQQDLLSIYEMTIRDIGPDIAPFEVVKSVYSHNPLSFWGIYRSNDERRRFPKLVGFVSYLPLNAAGYAALNDKTLKGRAPDLNLLAPAGEDPAALYLWAIVSPGLQKFAFMLAAHAIGVELYGRLPQWGVLTTESAVNALKRSSKSPQAATAQIGSNFELQFSEKQRAEWLSTQIFEGERANGQSKALRAKLSTVLAASSDHMAKVMAIRAAVFLVEQNCPYDEEFDGNDYAGAHVLGLVDGEPAAVLRIRYFAEFVKLERLAVLPRFRRTLIAKEVVERAIEICRRKGYRKMYGHAQSRLVPLWSRFGFEPMSKNSALNFSDHDYVEMIADIPAHENPLTPYSDPLVLIRPEGQWDTPGVLDRSALRPPTNPH
jgi:predicted GNAT family N-acyltransferase